MKMNRIRPRGVRYSQHAIFKHEPLAPQYDSFRLLEVFCDLSSSGLIQCTIESVPLFNSDPNPIEYKALSYVWGQSGDERTILVNGARTSVRWNLFGFLDTYRSSTRRYSDRLLPAAQTWPTRTLLWIDALCIDQTNIMERNHQVQRMRHIYQGASEVMIWLGQGETEIEEFVAGSHRTEVDGHAPDVLRDLQEEPPESFQSLDYWSRAWVAQEFVLARSRTLLYGRASVSSGWFRHRVGMRGHKPTTYRRESSLSLAMDRFIAAVDPLVGTLPLLCSRIDNFSDLLCSEPQDKVYALVAMSTHPEDFPINYHCSHVELFINTASYCLMDLSNRASCRRANVQQRVPDSFIDEELLYDIRAIWRFSPTLTSLRAFVPRYATPPRQKEACHLKLSPFIHVATGTRLGPPLDDFWHELVLVPTRDEGALSNMFKDNWSRHVFHEEKSRCAARTMHFLASSAGLDDAYVLWTRQEDKCEYVWLVRREGRAHVIAGTFIAECEEASLSSPQPQVRSVSLELYGDAHLTGLTIAAYMHLNESHWQFSDVRPAIVLFGLPQDLVYRRSAIRLMGLYDNMSTYKNARWLTADVQEYPTLNSNRDDP